MHDILLEILKNTDEIEILENSNESYLVFKSEYVYSLLKDILKTEYDELTDEIEYYFSYENIIDFIRYESGIYIYIIKL